MYRPHCVRSVLTTSVKILPYRPPARLIRAKHGPRARLLVGTLRYEDGKARTATAVDAGNLRGSRRVAKNKMLKMCIFAKDGEVNNLNFT